MTTPPYPNSRPRIPIDNTVPGRHDRARPLACLTLLLAAIALYEPGTASATGLIPSTNSSPPALDFWPFEDTNWLTHFSSAPISYTNLVNVPYLGDGNCLLLDSTNAAWLQYPTIQNGTSRLTISAGSVML